MANSNADDAIGWVVGLALLVGAGWWLLKNYEVVEKEGDPKENIANLELPRPREPYVITTTTTGTEYSLEPASVTGSRESRRAWIRMDHTNDKETRARETRELIWTNCETGEIKTLSRIAYSADGDVLSGENFEFSDARVEYYPVGTVGAAAPREICSEVFDEPDRATTPPAQP